MSKQGTWYFSKEELDNSPSRKDGIDKKQEQEYRELTCHHLQEVGKKLKLPQLAIATAIVFFHRFFARQSHKRYDRIVVATACLFLAGKVEEAPKKLNLVITTSYQILVAMQNNATPLKEGTPKFKELREKILAMERVLLQIIAFDMHMEHPYKYLMKYRQRIPGTPESIRQLVQIAWNFVNDSLRTTLALQHDAKTTAVAALYLAFKFLKMQAPDGRPWWLDLHGTATQDTLEDISNCILDLYNKDKEEEAKAKTERDAKAPPAVKAEPKADEPKPGHSAPPSSLSASASAGAPAAAAGALGPQRHSPNRDGAARAQAAPYAK